MPPGPPRQLETLSPLLRLGSRSRSPIASLRHLSSPVSSLAVLHTDGLLALWSCQDGRLLGQLDLADSTAYTSSTSVETRSSAAMSSAHNSGASTGGPLPSTLASLAALRSQTSSPAPHQSHGASRGSAISRPATPQGARKPAAVPRHISIVCLSSLHVLDDSDEPLLASYDSVKRRVLVVGVSRQAPDSMRLSIVLAIVLPEELINPSLLLAKVPTTQPPTPSLTAAALAADGGAIKVCRLSGLERTKARGLHEENAQTLHLTLPSSLKRDGDPVTGVHILSPDIFLVKRLKGCSLLRLLENRNLVDTAHVELESSASLRLLEGPKHPTGASWAVVASATGSKLLRIDHDVSGGKMSIEERTPVDSTSTCLSVLPFDLAGQSECAPDIILADVVEGTLSLHAVRGSDAEVKSLWTARKPQNSAPFSAVLPLGLEKVVVVNAAGRMTSTSLSHLVNGQLPHFGTRNAPQCTSRLSLLQQITSPRSQAKAIVGGFESGHIAFWDAASLELQVEWSLFTTPVEQVMTFGNEDNTLRLNSCLAVLAKDGTVGIIALDGYKMMCLIPGRGVRVERVAVRADEILILYVDERARVWDMASHELRRSIGVDQAVSLLSDGAGAWSQHHPSNAPAKGVASGVLSSVHPQVSSVPSLTADLGRALEAASKAVVSQTAVKGSGTRRACNILRPFLLALWPHGVDTVKDSILRTDVLGDGDLSVPTSSLFVGFSQMPQIHVQSLSSETSLAMQSSSALATMRLLGSLAMLNVLTRSDELQQTCTGLASWLVEDVSRSSDTSRASCRLGVQPSLLSLHLFDRIKETADAAQAIFAAEIEQESSLEIERLCAAWKGSLHSTGSALPPDSRAVQALSLLGFLGIRCYKSLDPLLLKDVAVAISWALKIGDKEPRLAVVALELCLRGFSIWQQYVDAMDLLRRVSAIAMAVDLEGQASSDLVAVARQTTLHIAQENTPLFMTTLHLDVIQASSAAQANSTMRLVAFIVRRRPLILYPNLPRLAEAVVKSLDPTNRMREEVLQSATLMISELIATYPSISFHNRLQRIAIGTHEGAIVLYDLKTATRLFILEGHKGRLDGVSFSPDGRRIVSVSIPEGKMLGWKVGSSIAGFFNPGMMPRQGGSEHDPSGAYKSMALPNSVRAHMHAHAKHDGTDPGNSGGDEHTQRSQARGGWAGVQGAEEVDASFDITFSWSSDREVRVDFEGVSVRFNVS